MKNRSMNDSSNARCALVNGLKARRVAALAELSANPFTRDQSCVLPVQNLLLRELESIGLELREHASRCDDCYLNHHLSPRQIQIETGGAGGVL